MTDTKNILTIDVFEKAMNRERLLTNEHLEKVMERMVTKDHLENVIERERLLTTERFVALEEKMMEGFTLLNNKIDYAEERLSSKIDDLALTKADKEDVLHVHKRVVRLEKKLA